jgi:hypothetical protein
MFSILSDIVNLINLIKEGFLFIKNFRKRKLKQASLETTLQDRFIQLFEVHNVHRNQIPRFFQHGLAPKDLDSNDDLLKALTEEMLEDACNLFAVNREWLDGESKEIYTLHDFYEEPYKFREFLSGLVSNAKFGIRVIVLAPETCIKTERNEALLIIEEPIQEIGNKMIYRYHLCNNWISDYWKSRAYLTACITMAWNMQLTVIGRKVDNNIICKIDGTEFISKTALRSLISRGKPWYPEDMALFPEAFLDELDFEINNFGLISGLRLWIELYDEGLMQVDVGKKGSKEVYLKFQDALNKCQYEMA